MGLFDALSAGLGAAAPVGAGLAQGQAQAAQSNVGFLEKLAQMKQQKQAADLQRQVAQSTIGENVAQAAVRNAKVAANNRAQNYLNSNQFKQDVQALRDSADPGAIARISANVAGSEHEEALRPLMQGALTLQKFAPGEGYIDRKTQKIVVPVPKSSKDEEPVIIQGTDPKTGLPVAYRVRKSGGPAELVEGFQGKAGGGAGGGALANRQKDYVALMEQGFPDMKTLSSKIDPNLITAAIKSPALANYVLGDNEQQYLASARNFLAGVLHEESGARLSDAQLQFGMQRYFPIGGDSPTTVARKLKNAEETMEARKRNANYVPLGAPLSPQAQAEIATTQSVVPSDATSRFGFPRPTTTPSAPAPASAGGPFGDLIDQAKAKSRNPR